MITDDFYDLIIAMIIIVMILKAFQVTILHLNQFVCVCNYSKYILNNIYTSLQAFGVSLFFSSFFYVFDRSFLCSPRLHQKYSNIVKCYKN